MKHFIITIASIFYSAFLMAQVPDIMNYQAVARNNSGQALASQTIKVRLSIVKNNIAQYSETRQVTTNALGLFNVQIGSAGALSTTGDFAAINWENNAAPGYGLKVELDISNSGLFTDMGSQALVSVPFAFSSKMATETANIGGKPLAQNMAPLNGSHLGWNGINWISVKKDSVYNISYSPNFTSIGFGNWQFLSAEIIPYFIVTGNERIIANLVSSVGNAGASYGVQVAVCYQRLDPLGDVTPFSGFPTRVVVPAGTSSIMNAGMIAANGAISLPPGSYRIGLGIKVLNTTGSALPYGGVNGTVEIRN